MMTFFCKSLRPSIATAVATLACAVAVTSSAEAALRLSNKPTHNVACSAGVCAATAKNAVLNVGDLAGMLATANVSVQSGSAARDIELVSSLSWASASRLTLDAYRSIGVAKPLTVAGSGALTLAANDGGSDGALSFQSPGRIVFWDLSSSLVIDGAGYTLVGDLPTLSSDIAADPSGHYALANNYDASADGAYQASPIGTTFMGAFEGLGNSISHFTIDTHSPGLVGLFGEIGSAGSVTNLVLDSVDLTAKIKTSGALAVAPLAARNDGLMRGNIASGTLYAADGSTSARLGGLVAINAGTIERSGSSVGITTISGNGVLGGLAGENDGAVLYSFATGSESAGRNSVMGGLVGSNTGASATISRSFATGGISSGYWSNDGGLVGENAGGSIDNSYSVGPVSAPASTGGGVVGDSNGPISAAYGAGHITGNWIGGFAGYDHAPGSFTKDYWDRDTSGISDLSEGANYPRNDAGITGLTHAQLQAGLPAGFDPAIWAEDPSINSGLPYLIANPPPP
jgi:hypothetical protein